MSKRMTMAAIGGLAILVLVTLLGTWPMINVVETGRTPEYPDLQPRRYEAGGERVFDAAMHAVNRLPRWTLISYEPESGEIRAEAKTPVFRFVDDVRIRVAGQDGATVVSVRSASRIGRGDFGQNARNIRAFFDELDRQIKRDSGHEELSSMASSSPQPPPTRGEGRMNGQTSHTRRGRASRQG